MIVLAASYLVYVKLQAHESVTVMGREIQVSQLNFGLGCILLTTVVLWRVWTAVTMLGWTVVIVSVHAVLHMPMLEDEDLEKAIETDLLDTLPEEDTSGFAVEQEKVTEL